MCSLKPPVIASRLATLRALAPMPLVAVAVVLATAEDPALVVDSVLKAKLGMHHATLFCL